MFPHKYTNVDLYARLPFIGHWLCKNAQCTLTGHFLPFANGAQTGMNMGISYSVGQGGNGSIRVIHNVLLFHASIAI